MLTALIVILVLNVGMVYGLCRCAGREDRDLGFGLPCGNNQQ